MDQNRRKENIDLEGEFEPSLLNSAVYLLQLIQEISTFAVNYQGRPFRESIGENRTMYFSLLVVAGIAFSCSTEFIPEINEKLRLVKFSTEFKITITALMAIDYAACWIIEKVLKYLFSDYRPKDIAIRRPDQLEAERRRKELEAQEAEREREQKQTKKLLEAAAAAGFTAGAGTKVKSAREEGGAEKEKERKKGKRDGAAVANGGILR